MGQDLVPGGVSGLSWLAAPIAMFYGNLPKFGNNVKIGNKVQFGKITYQNREITERCSKSIVRKKVRKKDWSQQVEHMKVPKKGLVSTSRTYESPKGTGTGVLMSKRTLLACHRAK